ncbi:hypothetical protein H072_7014 [Dactylellina haptotyla CBS 200.50]|uniref:Translation initiation factor eIF4e n=1 Tax=Dactylellina haptotyla (strain CBS 200.50) TaxID=1284197 RepID=S8ADR9_DACHA|nr:hypothetical protein H072_7014 [Dactylellina haptotyla CBS 200.50]
MATTASNVPSLHVNGPASGNGSPTSENTSPTSVSDEPVVQSMGNRKQLVNTMLKKMRPLPLRHEWTFWHDKYQAETGSGTAAGGDGYASQLKELANLSTIQDFWQVYNNTPFESLALRDSLLLFKKNVKPIWEDPRNNKGGSWTFRISKNGGNSSDFWKETLMMAIGEVLQEVVEKGDDICGVSISVRFNSHLILVWNRDSSNQKSIDAILKRVLENLSEEIRPLPQNYYYKKHSEHKGYKAIEAPASTSKK